MSAGASGSGLKSDWLVLDNCKKYKVTWHPKEAQACYYFGSSNMVP